MTDNSRGALYMTLSMLAFVANDSLMKTLAEELPLFEALALRALGAMLLLAPAVAVTRTKLWGYSPSDGWRIFARTLAEAASAGFYVTALYHLPIANATAILQALPLTVTLAGAIFLRDKVGWRRMTAILIGFGGMLLIVRPGPEGFDIWALPALAAVATVTLREILTRQLSAAVPSLAVSFYTTVGATVLGLAIASATHWEPLSSSAALRLGAAIACLVCGYIFSVKAMRVGELAVVNPFRYTSLLFALIFGLAVFAQFPDALTLAGAALVAATGIFTLWRERQVAPYEPGPTDLRLR